MTGGGSSSPDWFYLAVIEKNQLVGWNIIGVLFKLERPGYFGISFAVLPTWRPEILVFKVKAGVNFISMKSLKGKYLPFLAKFSHCCCEAPRIFFNFFLHTINVYVPENNWWKFYEHIWHLCHFRVWGLLVPPAVICEPCFHPSPIGLNKEIYYWEFLVLLKEL